MAKTKAKPSPVVETKKPMKRNKPTGDQTFIKDIKPVTELVTQKVDGNQLVFSQAITQGRQLIADGLQLITATVAMQNLTPVEIRETFDYVTGLEEAVDETRKLSRQRILDLALRTGEPSGPTGKGRTIHFADGRTLNCKTQKSGTDPKKFEANLRAKGADVPKYMVQVITYKMGDSGAIKSIDDGIFTQDEVDAMAYDISYAVERSKEAKDGT